MKFPVFDLHCDTAYRLLGNSLLECGSLRMNDFHVDLERASRFSGYAQCFACYTSTLENRVSPVLMFERELAAILYELEHNSDMIALAYNAGDVMRNLQNGKMSAILTIEGPAGFGFDPELLSDLYHIGFRMTTLCWNEQNPLTGSHLTGGALTDQGREYVRKAQKTGMIVDVSHISQEAFWNVIDITQAPIIASHSNSAMVYEHSRNISNDMFRAICDSNGVVGINLYSDFLGNAPTVDTVCDHVIHFMEMDPEGKHISLGGDLDGCDCLPDGFTGIQDYEKLANRLLDRGLSKDNVMNIFWNNALGVFERCCI